MKRLSSLVLAVTVCVAWLVSSAAQAGQQRSFGNRCGSGGVVVAQPDQDDSGSYRRYSYEPSANSYPTYRSYTTYRRAEPKKQPWQYPKADPRRYRIH